MTHDIYSMFTMLAGKAWRGTTEMVANPEILKFARKQTRGPSMRAVTVSVGRPAVLARTAAR